VDGDARRTSRRRLVVVGNGMVGHRLVQAVAERGLLSRFDVTVLSEESRLAYDRVNLSKWFDTGAGLDLVAPGEYEGLGIEVIRGEAAAELDCAARRVRTASGRDIFYDKVVLATGSYPFVPPIEGRSLPGAFVYRTIDDLEAIRAAAAGAVRGVVIGGGLLGLEAANALRMLGLDTHVVEFAPRLMPLQIDDAGGAVLRARIEALGVHVHTGRSTRAIVPGPNGRVRALEFAEGADLDVDLVVFSAGIRPRDEIARAAGLAIGARGGVSVDERCRTSDADVFAIGECAAFEGRTYGLVAPGYRMAEVVAATLAGEERSFTGFDMSTKLKLLGVDVASFGDAFGSTAGSKVVSLFDSGGSIYKKLVVTEDGKRLLGGILVGDASAYTELTAYVQGGL
jgi:nitrite reductase (NADH) large subunit